MKKIACLAIVGVLAFAGFADAQLFRRPNTQVNIFGGGGVGVAAGLRGPFGRSNTQVNVFAPPAFQQRAVFLPPPRVIVVPPPRIAVQENIFVERSFRSSSSFDAGCAGTLGSVGRFAGTGGVTIQNGVRGIPVRDRFGNIIIVR